MFNEFASSDDLDKALADRVALELVGDIDQRETATLAVSGGRTPAGFFRRLSNTDLNWSRVTVLLVDERWVPADHEDSNERLVRDTLLKNNAAAASMVGMWTGDSSPQTGLEQCEQLLQSLQWPLSAVILGMGADGHSASWFPGGITLEEQLSLSNTRLCMAGKGVQPRMTLTLAAVLDCKFLALHFTGKEKRMVFEQARNADDNALPISAVLRQLNTPVNTFWCP